MARCGREDIDVHFLVGGTQTNLTVIGSILRPYQGVFCADTGHLNVHETGAIEATGHKVIVLPTTADGRLTAAEIRKAYEAHWNDATHEHMVQPGMVYISQSTEDGTAYTKAELEEISAICRKCELPLFIDGARCLQRADFWGFSLKHSLRMAYISKWQSTQTKWRCRFGTRLRKRA